MDRIAKASLKEIKEKLDPRFCYLIIENRSKNGLLTDFDVVLERLAIFGKDIPTQSFYEDFTTSWLLMVVPFEEALEEKVMDIVIYNILPDHMVYYLYKSSSRDKPHAEIEF